MAQNPKRARVANVFLWGARVGAVAWEETREYATFEYAPSFLKGGFEISPITMPRRSGIFSFPTLNRKTFNGLPGLLADCLPDRYGNALIDIWLSRQGRAKEDFTPVERLCYIGTRGMGALEFKPTIGSRSSKSIHIEIAELTELAQKVLDTRAGIQVNLDDPGHAMNAILRVGTSAGGARPKALISWNRTTNEVRSGDVPPPPGFEPWILKFDGIQDQSLGDPKGYGRIEFAYHRMALDSGIRMNECKIFSEGERAHFMTRRFDRTQHGSKVHMQSLCALEHYDFNAAGEYGYEQAFMSIQKLNLGYPTLTEMFRRMVFNIVSRNQDDHTHNIAFLMDETGRWELSPAFDITWAFNPSGVWTNHHQMSVNGKRDGFNRSDLIDTALRFGIKNPDDTLDRILAIVKEWPKYAEEAEIPAPTSQSIGSTHRLHL
jgi:serine/threonine-protein kinase HipA